MELSWVSFTLEIINFLVLIWILKHFFYAPIKNTIAQRKQKIQENLNQAKTMQEEAKQLQARYESRLQEWEKEKESKSKILQDELEGWKSKEMADFKIRLEDERGKMQSQEHQRMKEIVERNAHDSIHLAAEFAAKILEKFADSALEKKIIDSVTDVIVKMPDDKKSPLKKAVHPQKKITVETAYPMDVSTKQKLETAIASLFDEEIDIDFSENHSLLAGLRILFGSIMVQANLQDELAFFANTEM